VEDGGGLAVLDFGDRCERPALARSYENRVAKNHALETLSTDYRSCINQQFPLKLDVINTWTILSLIGFALCSSFSRREFDPSVSTQGHTPWIGSLDTAKAVVLLHSMIVALIAISKEGSL